MSDISIKRHSMAHILASAVLKFYPDAKIGIGPSIDEGFYYDFEFSSKFNEDNLHSIQNEMNNLIKSSFDFIYGEWTFEEAKEIMKNQPYKLDLIKDLESENKKPTFYKSENFIDLCAGPHVSNSSELSSVAFEIDRIAGAYWKGNEKNTMMTRIYVLCFESQIELDEFKKNREEARARDHKIIGEQLDLFSFNGMAPGACFWHPRGLKIWQELEKLWRDMHNANGYTEIQTPQLAKKNLWETSGHWDHYHEDMYHFSMDNTETLCLKPMDCPFGILIYKTKPHSYRDFPIRFNEIGRIFRNEKSGQLNGLFRVRQITQDDAHIYCTEEQVFTEISSILKMQREFYSLFGLEANYFLSTRPDDFMGEIEVWNKAEDDLREALKKNGIENYGIKDKDGAFYGPKIDVQVKDALGRTWQLATIQLDFQLPARFDMEYTDSDGKRKTPVMIHRAIFGSFERFIGIVTEQTAGNFPLWLTPEQVRIVCVSAEKHADYVNSVAEKMRQSGIRVEIDLDNETLGNKIRKATSIKIPYVVVVGDKEMESNILNIRKRGEKDTINMNVDEFISNIKEKINLKSSELSM